MKKKFLLAIVLALTSLLAIDAIIVSAATSGTCGTNLTWKLDYLGTLTISGEGAMTNYSYSSHAPWDSERKNIKKIVIKDGVTSIGDCAFYYYDSPLDLNVPDSIKSIIIPDSVTSIGYSAFEGCRSLTSITIPNSVTSIGEEAFSRCYGLASITIPDGVTSIGNYTFYCCHGLASVTIPDSVTNIGYSAFEFCRSLTSIIIPDSVTSIGNYAFRDGRSLTSIIIPDSVTSIGDSAFEYCDSLENIIVDEDNTNYSSIDGVLFNKNKTILVRYPEGKTDVEYIIPDSVTSIGEEAFSRCESPTGITVGDSVTNIGYGAFEDCANLTSITIPDSVTSIGYGAFDYCESLKTVYYNGTKDEFDDIYIDSSNNYLENAEKKFFRYVTIIGGSGERLSKKMYDVNALIDISDIEEKYEHTIHLYTDSEYRNEYDLTTPNSKNLVLYLRYVPNQYTYKFIDEDGSVLKEETVDYGTVIIAPEISDKTEYYLFDYWQGHTENMTVTEDVTFKAVYKYKNYLVNAEGLSEPTTVTYNSNFTIKPQKLDDYHYFIGYFREENGKGTQITNEKGESLSVYNVISDLKVYPYFYEGYMNKVELQCVETAMPGDTITQSAIFATDKNATYFIGTVKYPKHLNFKSIKGIDFKEAAKDFEKIVDDYKYADITCVFDYEGNFAEINTNYIPFEIEFDVNTDATLGACEISIENVMLIGEDSYEITDIKSHTITILPKLAESIEIVGKDEIDATEQFSAVVSPDYTTNKSVVWSVNDESIATISQDGTVTPVKNGTVIITATAEDGSEVFATKTVNVIAYAKINSLDFGDGVVLTEFNPDVRKYTIYIKEDATSISLTPTFSGGGVLRPNGSGIWLSGRSKDFELNDVVTTITFNRENVTDMTNSIYTIKVVKLKGTKTTTSDDGKAFTVMPIGIEVGKTVVLALYDGEQFVEMQNAVYNGEALLFTTDKAYTNAKVMVWDDLASIKPVCGVEEIN